MSNARLCSTICDFAGHFYGGLFNFVEPPFQIGIILDDSYKSSLLSAHQVVVAKFTMKKLKKMKINSYVSHALCHCSFHFKVKSNWTKMNKHTRMQSICCSLINTSNNFSLLISKLKSNSLLSVGNPFASWKCQIISIFKMFFFLLHKKQLMRKQQWKYNLPKPLKAHHKLLTITSFWCRRNRLSL